MEDTLVKILYEKHKEIEELSKGLRTLKGEYEAMSDQVKESMKLHQVEKIKVSDGIFLHLKEKKSFSSISKEYILETLKNLYTKSAVNQVHPDQLAEISTETLVENRDSKVNLVLKFLKR